MAWVYLGLAIGAEMVGTLSLKASDGFSRWGPAVLVVIGYGSAFALLGLALTRLSVGASYAVWSGLGTVGAAAGGAVLFGERLSGLVLVGIGLVVTGVVIITLGEGAR